MELQQLIQKFGEQYKGNRYHLLQKNCNHFASELCFQLVGKTAPSWVSPARPPARPPACSCAGVPAATRRS
jgi:hypothetical protein